MEIYNNPNVKPITGISPAKNNKKKETAERKKRKPQEDSFEKILKEKLKKGDG